MVRLQQTNKSSHYPGIARYQLEKLPEAEPKWVEFGHIEVGWLVKSAKVHRAQVRWMGSK